MITQQIPTLTWLQKRSKWAPIYFSLYSTIEKPKLKLTKSVSKDGIYCFGGINAKGELNNNLMYFSIDTKTPNWNRVLTKGSPPAQRYLHTMEYCPELSCLVLFGGRKEKIDLKQKQFCFNDLWLFYIQSSQWQEINFNSNGPEARHWHVSWMYGTKLLIFGGINPKGLWSPNTYIIELKKEL